MKGFIACLRAPWVVLTLILIVPVVAAAQGSGNEVLNFAVGWRADIARSENVLQLGTVYPCSTGWCVVVEEYSGSLNLRRMRLNYRHTMQADTHAQGCKDEYLTTVKGARSAELKAQLRNTGSGYVVEAGRYRYVWSRDTEKPAGYLLQEAGEIAPSELQYSQPVGFSYWSDDAQKTHFERTQYNGYFDGKIAHKDTLTGVRDDWKVTRTSIDFRKFLAAPNGSPVLGLTTGGHPEVLKRMKKPVSVYQSVLPPSNTTGDRLRFFNHEYGHDFNANGCFDEFGHNKLMLPILQKNTVVAFVFVEYTYDKFDGVPMISVGRYHR